MVEFHRLAGLAQGAVRSASDWIDLKWSHHVRALSAAAPFARGRLLDVGCGDKPHEAIFRPYVEEYLGIEKRATFGETAASNRGGGPDLLYDGDRLPFPDCSFDTVLS